ncbi:MAG: hypothetical protein WA055_05950 [Candidatus Moraniibacteriota bacterium]
MHHSKHLYITGAVTGAIVGLIASISAYGMLQYVAAGNSVVSLSIITMIIGALVGIAVAFIMHKTSKA